MIWGFIAGYVIGGILLWIGIVGGVAALKTTSRQLFGLVGIFVLVSVLAFTFDEIFHWWIRMPKTIILAAALFIVAERSFRTFRGTKSGGTVVLDLGRVRMPDMIINVFTGLALTWFAWLNLSVAMKNPHWVLDDISLPVFGLAIAYAVLIQAFVRRKVLQGGIFYGTGLLPWRNIRSFEWEKDSAMSSTLVLHKQMKFPLLHLATLSIKSELIPSVEGALRSRGIDAADEKAAG